MDDITQPRHDVTLSDVDLFIINSALDELYQAWRSGHGAHAEYVASRLVSVTQGRIPDTPANVASTSKIHARLVNEHAIEVLRKAAEPDGSLTPEGALEALRHWDEIGNMRW